MELKEYFEDVISEKEKEIEELREKINKSDSVDEVRCLGDKIEKLKTDIAKTKEQLTEEREKEKRTVVAQCNFDPSKALNVNKVEVAKRDENPRATMEYRTAFKDYFQKGIKSDILQWEKRSLPGVADDLGVLIPETVIQEIIQEVEKVYGQLYSKVKKTNFPGAVKYPIGNFSATFTRITESTVSSRQKGGEITDYVEFSYNLGEIRIARTLLQTVLSVPVFERELAKVIVKAYVEAMDKEIIGGVAARGQCEGILTEANKINSRIPSTNIIDFTAAEIADWVEWEKKFFAEIPLSLENINAEFVMAKQTYVANLCTLKDDNNQPIMKAGFDASDKRHKFNEYNVNRVEQDIFKSFDNCTNGEYFGMFWLPERAYAINSNLEFTVSDYFDYETNQFVKRALVINDGKILDPKYIYLFRKSTNSNRGKK